jgi:hypothetical protein
MALRDEVAADLYQEWVEKHPTSGLVGVPFAQASDGLRAYWLTFVDAVLGSLQQRGYGLIFGGSLPFRGVDPTDGSLDAGA